MEKDNTHIYPCTGSDPNAVYHLNAEELEAVNEGLTQLKNGKFLTNEEVNAEFDKWLKRNEIILTFSPLSFLKSV